MDVQYPLFISYSIILFVHLRERWCVPPIVMYVVMVDDSIYDGVFLVGNDWTIARLGLGIIIRYVGLITRPLLWGGNQYPT